MPVAPSVIAIVMMAVSSEPLTNPVGVTTNVRAASVSELIEIATVVTRSALWARSVNPLL